MWVIKLGGSLIGSEELGQWLQKIAKLGDGKVIIVPGGGLFADAVREAQQLTSLDDKTAHQMAVMSMDQFGVMMAGMNHDLATAASELELAERGWQHRGIIWLPSKMVMADDTIPTNWDVTSDSLAAWLAQKVGASHLLLVKSTKPLVPKISLSALQAEDIVDSCLKDFIGDQEFKTWVVDKSDYRYFTEAFTEDQLQLIGSQVTE